MKIQPSYFSIILLFLVYGLLGSCARNRFDDPSNGGNVSFTLRTSAATGIQAKSNAQENDIKGVYLIVLDPSSKFLECRPATFVSDDKYVAALSAQGDEVTVVAVANVASLVESKQGNWVVGSTTYDQIASELLTEDLRSSNGSTVVMPELAPLFAEQVLPRIDIPMTVATPFVLERATAKLTIDASAAGLTVLGANLYHVPTQGYVFPKQPTVLSLGRVNYIGSDGAGGYTPEAMIAAATDADPLYCYETPLSSNPTEHPFLIVRSNRGYYRINLVNSAGEQLNLQRNYWYKVLIMEAASDGYPSADEAIRNPPLNVEILVTDPNAHEIISNGTDYLGLSNSEFILYDSHVINEFNRSVDNNNRCYYDTINGFLATTLTYESRTAGTVTCVECTTKSKGTQPTGIWFRDVPKGPWDTAESNEELWGWQTRRTAQLALPATAGSAISKRIIVTIPHDFTGGKIKITLGTLEREVVLHRRELISWMGDVLDMGTGYSTATVDMEETFSQSYHGGGDIVPFVERRSDVDFIRFSTAPNGGWQKALLAQSTDRLYVKVDPINNDPDLIFKEAQYEPLVCSEFYLTRAADQTRTKVHLLREPFGDGTTDAHTLGSKSEGYCAAFWRNDQTGERIIRVGQPISVYWIARVLHGKEFIRLAHLDERTPEEIQNGNAEDYQPDATWSTLLEQPHGSGWSHTLTVPQFRIGLTSKNTTGKPRYGMVMMMAPYTQRGGETHVIFVRQGEEADALFSTSDTYQGAPRAYAQAFLPYNLTVPDPANHPGGPNFSDHKSMNGRGVPTQYPTQVGYGYQWGSDVAIHPTNPKPSQELIGRAYNYAAPYKEVCPQGYTLPITDEQNSAYTHSLLHEIAEPRGNKGLCADGFMDRGIPRSAVGTGAETADRGRVFYNTETLASLFITTTMRSPTEIICRNNFLDIRAWGRLVAPSSPHTQALIDGSRFVGTSNILAVQDRKGASSVRCVKIDARHETGGVPTPGGGDYKPWN